MLQYQQGFFFFFFKVWFQFFFLWLWFLINFESLDEGLEDVGAGQKTSFPWQFYQIRWTDARLGLMYAIIITFYSNLQIRK